jgi:hypothetical protein
MKGYPKHIATKQDFLNLLSMPEHKAQAQVDLKKVLDVTDDKASRTISINAVTQVAVTEVIDNPAPLYKLKGFQSRKVLSDLIAVKAAVDVILEEKPVDEKPVEEKPVEKGFSEEVKL